MHEYIVFQSRRRQSTGRMDSKNSRFNVNQVTEAPDVAGDVPALQEYIQYGDTPEPYVVSLRHMTHEALPRIDQYRDIRSIHAASRPSLDELHNEMTITQRNTSRRWSIKPKEGDAHSGHHKFGWIQGVLILNLMNLWGPMLFLRTSWLVGQGGLIEAFLVILFSALITTITALSTSAIATNGEVKGGGTYYMLSRSLGPEYGGAIGLIFAFANMVGVALNVVGFCESLLNLFSIYNIKIIDGGVNDTRIIGIITVFVCVVICLVGMEWEQKAQNILLIILLVAISDVIVGSFLAPNILAQAKGVTGWNATTIKDNLLPDYRGQTFITIFSVYFPSATGILAGANISGELKNPQHAIPRGTLWAIFITTVSYLMVALVAGGCVIRDASGIIEDLTVYKNYTDCASHLTCNYGLENSFEMLQNVAGYKWLVYAGNFAATISSALACLVGAPRVFQALCRDKIYPYIYWFGKGYGKADDPVRSYGLTFVIACAFIAIGELNMIAVFMSTFFMAAFCLINFACFHAAMAKSPGFRPGFRFWNMWVSFVGALLCLVVMFIMNWVVSIVTIIICFALYLYLYFKKPDVNWGSSAQAETYRQALRAALDLNQIEEHVKTYRPQILVLTGKPSSRPALLDFANSITKGISLMVCGHVLKNPLNYRSRADLTKKMNAWLKKRHCKAFYSSTDNESLEKGAKALLQLVGVGKMRPNMLMMGYKTSWQNCDPQDTLEFVNIIHDAFDMHLAVGILRLQKGLDYSFFTDTSDAPDIPPKKLPNGVGESIDSGLEMAAAESTGSLTDAYVQSENKSNKTNATLEQKLNQDNPKKKKRKMSRRKSCVNDIPKEIVEEINQFQEGNKNKGTIDVWWLYDDGGLTLLIPYILSTRKTWHKSKLRIFSLANRNNQIDEEQRNLVALLHKFRIECLDVVMLPDVTKAPRESTVKEYNEIIAKFSPDSKTDDQLSIPEEELIAFQDKSNRHMRVHELLMEHSREATLVVMTLPMPKKNRISCALYMSWLEILTKGLPPCLLLRGNQTTVLTFYS